jgi:hypothetical protein
MKPVKGSRGPVWAVASLIFIKGSRIKPHKFCGILSNFMKIDTLVTREMKRVNGQIGLPILLS